MSGSVKKVAGQLLPIAGAALGVAFPALAPIIVGASGLIGAFLASDAMSFGDWGAQAQDADLIQSNFKSTQKTIPLVYGKRRVGSNDVFMEMSGSGDTRIMWIVSCLAEGECQGIAVDPKTGQDQIFVDSLTVDEFNKKHEEKNGIDGIVRYHFHNGSSSQNVDTAIHAAIPRFTDTMRNTCYVVWEIKWVKGLFAGLPIRQVVLLGKKIEDIRTGQVVYSTNPALQLYDYLINERYGLAFSRSWISSNSFMAAATYCEGTAERHPWATNYVVGSQIRSQTIIDTLLAHFRGNLTWYDGSLFLNYAQLDEEVVVGNITDEDIILNQNGFSQITVSQPSSFMMPTSALIKYTSEFKNWTLDDVNVGDKLGLTASYEFPAFTDRKLAVFMGTYMLERTQLNRTFTVNLRASNIVFEPNDLVRITSSEAALASYLCRVIQSDIMHDGTVLLSMIAEATDLYNKQYDIDPDEVYKLNIADPSEAPPSVYNIQFSEEIYHYRERSFVRLNVSYVPPNTTPEGLDYPWFDYVEVHVSYDGIKYEFLFNSPYNFQIDPVGEVQIWLKLVSVSSYGQAQRFENAATATYQVRGVSGIRPERELSFTVTVTDNTVAVYAPIRSVPDLEGYEIRLGNEWFSNEWRDASLLTITTNPTISFSPVKPGQHSLWMDVKGKNGLYSSFPVRRDFYIQSPPVGYSDSDQSGPLAPIDISFTEGAHYGTRVVDVAGEDALQVNRGSTGAISGYYVSRVYDTRSHTTEKGRGLVVAVSCGTALIGGGVTWDDIAPAGFTTTWKTLAPGPGITTWNDVTGETNEASTIAVEVQCSNDGVSGWTTYYGLERLTATVYTANYMRFVFRMRDPQASSHYTIGPARFSRFTVPPKVATIGSKTGITEISNVTGILSSIIPPPP